MRISYDAEVDALYIRLIEGKHQCRTMRVTDEVSLNIAEGEVLVGIEILQASHTLGHHVPPTVILENVQAIQT